MIIEVSTNAQKFIMLQTDDSKKRIKAKINILIRYIQENKRIPFHEMDIKVLKGKWYPYKRLRIGKFRVIFEIDFKEQIFSIIEFDNRGDVY